MHSYNYTPRIHSSAQCTTEPLPTHLPCDSHSDSVTDYQFSNIRCEEIDKNFDSQRPNGGRDLSMMPIHENVRSQIGVRYRTILTIELDVFLIQSSISKTNLLVPSVCTLFISPTMFFQNYTVQKLVIVIPRKFVKVNGRMNWRICGFQ